MESITLINTQNTPPASTWSTISQLSGKVCRWLRGGPTIEQQEDAFACHYADDESKEPPRKILDQKCALIPAIQDGLSIELEKKGNSMDQLTEEELRLVEDGKRASEEYKQLDIESEEKLAIEGMIDDILQASREDFQVKNVLEKEDILLILDEDIQENNPISPFATVIDGRPRVYVPRYIMMDPSKTLRFSGINTQGKEISCDIEGSLMIPEEDALKFVIAHEIGHLVLGHNTVSLVQEAAFILGSLVFPPSVLTYLLGRTLSLGSKNWKKWCMLFAVSYILNYRYTFKYILRALKNVGSQAKEKEADLFAAKIVGPEGGIKYFTQMQEGFLSLSPSPEQEQFNKFIQEALGASSVERKISSITSKAAENRTLLDRLICSVYQSHPLMQTRIQYLREFRGQQP